MGGCGGGSASNRVASRNATGKATVTIKWPKRSRATSRVIPSAANSVVITLTNISVDPNAKPLQQTGTLQRPYGDAGGTSTWYSNDLPVGDYSVDVKAYADNSNQGAPLAVGHQDKYSVLGNQSATPITVTLASTVTQLTISPPPSSIAPGSSTALSIHAQDASNSIVLISPSTVQWTSSDPTIATIDATGITPTIHGIKFGIVQISAKFIEVEPLLGQQTIVASPVSVSVPIDIAIDPVGTFYQTLPNDAPHSPLILDLASLGIAPGMTISLREFGNFSYDNVHPAADVSSKMTGIFSTNNALLGSSVLNRVPGAIQTTLPQIDFFWTFFVQQAFEIPDASSLNAVVPSGARYLFICAPDAYWSDNTSHGFGIEIAIVPSNGS